LAVIAFVASINATDGDVFDGTFSELARTGNMGIAGGLGYDDAISEHYRDAAFAQVATRLSNANSEVGSELTKNGRGLQTKGPRAIVGGGAALSCMRGRTDRDTRIRKTIKILGRGIVGWRI
jgi:hypothetical protein